MSKHDEERHASVAQYYGEKLQSSSDLRTSACCPVDAVPPGQREIVQRLHPETTARFYGCGSPIPSHLRAATVLDLGCGTGRDAYVASALVGSHGSVIGVDMSEPQLAVARKHQSYHADVMLAPGAASNVDFRIGHIENLRAAGIDDASVDVVISNCVCNLVRDKTRVWREVARLLRDGGEFYFSDVYADRRLSEKAQQHPTLVAECLGGALYIEDYRRTMAEAGFLDVRIVSCAPVVLKDEELLALVPDVRFYSITSRVFKVKTVEDRLEDYGQTATFTGDDDGNSEMKFDSNYTFRVNEPRRVDANTAEILQCSRYAKYFTVSERAAHRGVFSEFVSSPYSATPLNGSMFGERAMVSAFDNINSGEEGCCAPVSEKAGCTTNGAKEEVKVSNVTSYDAKLKGTGARSAVEQATLARAPSEQEKTSCCGPGNSC